MNLRMLTWIYYLTLGGVMGATAGAAVRGRGFNALCLAAAFFLLIRSVVHWRELRRWIHTLPSPPSRSSRNNLNSVSTPTQNTETTEPQT